jgi:hypothetical protein
MKKIGIIMVALVLSLAAMSQKAVINFQVKSHDFGKVNEEDGKITYVFDFKNDGNAPLVVNRVQASCGCTTPAWTKEPIEPGKSGNITVTYNPAGRPGMFTKTITVYSNASEEQVVLIIKGEVIPKQTVENNPYPVFLGGISAKTKVVQMNNIEKGKTQIRTLEIKNTVKELIQPTIENLPPYITVSVVPEMLKPNEEGKITFTLDSKKCPQWGPVTENVYVNINGRKIKTEDTKIVVVSNIIEDFNGMTMDQKRKAPILEIVNRSLNAGTLKVGEKKVVHFNIKNNGQNALEIRRIINSSKEMVAHQTKLSVPGGRSGEITLTLNTKDLSEGDYKKSITIQTNDPQNSFMILVLNWSVKK